MKRSGWLLPGAALAVALMFQGCATQEAKPPAEAPKPAPAAPAPAPTAVPRASAPKPAPVKPMAEKVSLAADVLFDFDQAEIKPEGKARLDQMAGRLQGLALEVVIGVGHADSTGPEAYNQKLSMRRAEAVKAYLVSKGVEAGRVYTEGKGETQPLASNKTAAGRARNRRVEIEVIGTRRP